MKKMLKLTMILFVLVAVLGATFGFQVRNTFAQGNNDIIISHYDGKGNLVWTKCKPESSWNGHRKHKEHPVPDKNLGPCALSTPTPTTPPQTETAHSTEVLTITETAPILEQLEFVCIRYDFVSDITNSISDEQYINVYDVDEMLMQSHSVPEGYQLTELVILPDGCGWLVVSDGEVFLVRLVGEDLTFEFKTQGSKISAEDTSKTVFLFTFEGDTFEMNWETDVELLVLEGATDSHGDSEYFAYIRAERLWVFVEGGELDLGESWINPQIHPDGSSIITINEGLEILSLQTGNVTGVRNSEDYSEFTFGPDGNIVGYIENDQLCRAYWVGERVTDSECTSDLYVHSSVDVFTLNKIVKISPKMENISDIFLE